MSNMLFALDYDAPVEKFSDDLAPDTLSLKSRAKSFEGDGIGDDPYSPPPRSMYPIGKSLSINDYVDWDAGGTYAPEYWLGYDTGMNPADFRSYAMTGEVAVAPNQLEQSFSERWGDVGLSNYNQELVAGTEQNETAWLPSSNTLSELALIPGFGTEL